jgi:CBS domain-containing protein
MSVGNILKGKGREVATITGDETLAAAVQHLAQRRIGALMVTGADEPVLGIISERDIIRAIAAGGASALEEPVSRYMTRKVITCSESTGIDDLMSIMTSGKFRHVPVVESGKLVGIVSIGDVVKTRVAEIEAETQAIKEYIATA